MSESAADPEPDSETIKTVVPYYLGSERLVLVRADRALYKAKRGGRNRVKVAPASGPYVPTSVRQPTPLSLV